MGTSISNISVATLYPGVRLAVTAEEYNQIKKKKFYFKIILINTNLKHKCKLTSECCDSVLLYHDDRAWIAARGVQLYSLSLATVLVVVVQCCTHGWYPWACVYYMYIVLLY